MKKIAFYTLGCKLNFSETSFLEKQAKHLGYEIVGFKEKADVYIVNTCTVTQIADSKSRQMLRQANRKNPEAIVAAVGCFAQIKSDEIEKITGIDLILGMNEKFSVFEHIESFSKEKGRKSIVSCGDDSRFFHSFSSEGRTRSFLKVQDGCDYNCSYCAIPKARGKSRNPSIKSLVNQAEEIGKSGVKEIVLTGVNVGDFGQGSSVNFFKLISALDEVEQIERFRISSIEPNLLTSEIVEFVAASKRFMPHFHIPLQGGTDFLLGEMRRRYNTKLFNDKIEFINSVIPHAAIGIDIIAGFPSETEQEFMKVCCFIENLSFSYLHVFSYSSRRNTPSAKMKNLVSSNEKNNRSKVLHQLSEKKEREFYKRFIGTSREVLFENKTKRGKIEGYTDNYLRVESEFHESIINEIVNVPLQTLNAEGKFISNFSVKIL